MATAQYMREYRKRKPAIIRAVSQRHYHNHKQNYVGYRDAARQRIHALVRSAREVPCRDCNGIFPWYVMEFDHVPERGPKLFSIARATTKGINQVRAEIAKCDVVCANCHLIRTYKRGQMHRGNGRKVAYEHAA